MPPDIQYPQLPFLTREMLTFGKEATIELRIKTQSTRSGNVTIRGVTRAGAFTYQHTTVSNAAVGTSTFRIPDVPIWVTIADESDTYDQGSLYATAHILINGDVAYQLMQGFVYSLRQLSWPGSPGVDMRPTGGRIRASTNAAPTAGSEISYSVAANLNQRLLSFRVTLTTDANAANRRVHLVIRNGTTPLLDAFSDQDHAASTARNYTFAPFGVLPDTLDDNDILVPIPKDLILGFNFNIVTNTTNIQAGDAFGVQALWIEELFNTF